MKCQTCGKPLAGRQTKFCSRECSNRRNIISELRACKTCGKQFRVYPSQLDRYGDYCSLACSPRTIANKVKQCEYCGQDFVCVSRRQVQTRRFCSPQCAYDFRNSNTVVTCAVCGNPISTYPSHASRCERHFCSPECKSIGQSGAGNPAWKGGGGSYRGPNWWKQRAAARKRDSYTCQKCSKTETDIGQALDVHHTRPYRLFNNYKQANQLSNLVSFCHACHLDAERPLNGL